MGGAPHLVLVFGDQVGDTRQTIKELTRKSNSSLYLRQFLEETTASLTSELTNLEYGERSRFPRFTSILDLAESDFENPNFEPSVQTVLLCIAQLGSLIWSAPPFLIQLGRTNACNNSVVWSTKTRQNPSA